MTPRPLNSPSRNLRKYGQYQQGMQIVLAALALYFCLQAAINDSPIMDPETYGPVVTSVKAEFWSWPILVSSLVYILGIQINGNWRWSPALRLYGATFHTVTLTMFAFLSHHGEFVNPLNVLATIGAGGNLVFVYWNVGDLSRAISGNRR